MSNWLVIGASSFTGKHFCEYLKARDEKYDVGGLRSLHWLGSVDAETIVVNFAAVNVVAPSWETPGKYMKVNVGRVTEAIQKMKPARYIHVSTPEVYGSTTGFITEDAPYNPSTPYAVSRAAAEMMLKCYHKQYGLPVIFTRACNVYGPGQQIYRLIPKLIVSIKKGIRFPLEGGGSSYRAFLHVEDVCAATYLAATKGQTGQAYHISSTNLQSIVNIARMICEMMKVDFEEAVEIVSERPGKDSAYELRSQKIRELGWRDEIKLPEGIRSVIDWVEGNWDTLKDQPMEYEFKP